MSSDGTFQGFQGDLGTVGTSPATAQTARIKALQAEEERRRAALASRNLSGKGLVLDTNKPVIGGRTNIPSSRFQIIGGKAVPIGAGAPNISRSVPSILTKDRGRLTADSPNLTDAQKQALGIISGQQQATVNLAKRISAERRAQQLSGKTVAQAQEIATGSDSSQFLGQPANQREGGFAFTKRDQNVINTALQTDIIRSNAAKLNFAEELIKNQTDTSRSLDGNITSELDDLETLLASAPNQDAPINRINVQGDEFGNLVSPRNVKLQIENAGLTGGLNAPVLNIVGSQGVMPSVEQVQQTIQNSLSDITDNAEIGNLTTVTQLPDGTLAIDFSENAPEIFRSQFGDTVLESLGQFFNLRNQGIEDFFDNPEGLRIKIGEEEVSLGGSGGGGGGAGALEGGFDILGLVTNPIVLIAVAAIGGLVLFMKVRK